MNPLEFAAYELRRYAAKMGIFPEITFEVAPDRFDKTVFFRFDPALDDAFTICVKNGKGSITATNSRAVLLGVYRFLTLQGCRFLRPGKDGEYVPLTGSVKDCEETVYASTRHRGTEDYSCCGGIEGMLAVVDWLPKIMMNTYFTEWTDKFWGMKFAYRAGDNPYARTMDVSRELFGLWMERLDGEIAKRGILRHSAGHGWTTMLMDGVGELKCKPQLIELDEHPVCRNPEVLPMIGGKRTIWDNTPINTHLCLSNDAVRAEFVRHVCEYSAAHPRIDYLHVWLGDAFANFCECEACAAMTPTDWYVKLLNELDEALTKRGSAQRIVFLVYFELLYPPTVERIKNEDRFTLLFCPYDRDFTTRYRDTKPQDYTPALGNTFTRAHMNGNMYVKQLADWKKLFHGDSIVFDYTLYNHASFLDLTNLNTAALIADDCIDIKNMGLNGRIECGNPKAHTPTSLCFYTMAHSLFFGDKLSEKEFLADTFGEKQPIGEFLEGMRSVIPLEMIRKERSSLTKPEADALRDALARIEAFRPVLFAYSPSDAVHRESCRLFWDYLQIPELIFGIMLEKSEGMMPKRFEEKLVELRALLYRLEQSAWFTLPAKGLYVHWSNFLRDLRPTE